MYSHQSKHHAYRLPQVPNHGRSSRRDPPSFCPSGYSIANNPYPEKFMTPIRLAIRGEGKLDHGSRKDWMLVARRATV